jgi:transposase, IS5 family
MSLMGLFSSEECYTWVDAKGEALATLDSLIPWENLRKLLGPITFESGRGRPPLDALMMIKCLLLQSLYNISDEACEYQINDRLSFKRFLGLAMDEKAPDEKSIWLYRERIEKAKLHDTIFAWFEEELQKSGYAAQKGQIIDATFVPTHKPTGKLKKQQEQWVALTVAQERQQDLDATFTKKGNTTHHGYKNHINIDNKFKLIREFSVTTASTHDSQELDAVLQTPDDTGALANTRKSVWADSAYRSAQTLQSLKALGFRPEINHRAYRNTPLTEAQKATNTQRSSVRSRIEHVFGFMEMSMGGMLIHTIGLDRTKVKVAFKNLGYNIRRFACLQKQATA